MEGMSVGTISLDLTINKAAFLKELAGLGGISEKALAPAMDKVGQSMAQAVAAPTEKAAQAMRKSIEEVNRGLDAAERKNIQDVVSRVAAREKAAAQAAQAQGPEPVRTAQLGGYAKSATDVDSAKAAKAAAELAERQKQAAQEGEAFAAALRQTAAPAEMLQRKLDLINSQLDREAQKVAGIAAQARLVQLDGGDTTELDAEIDRAEEKMLRLQSAGEATRAKLERLLNPPAPAVEKQIKKAREETVKLGAEAKQAGAKAAGAFDRAGKSAKGLGRSIKNAAKSALLISVLYKAFRSMQEYMAKAAGANKQFAASLNEIKAGLAVSFQSIFSAILPALNALMQGIARAVTYIASLLAALFGTTYQQAAAGAKKLQGQAKKAGAEAKKSLASFDDLNILSDSSGGGDAGGQEAGTDFSAIEPPDMTWVDELKGKVAGVFDVLKQEFGPTLQAAFDKISPKVDAIRQTLAGALGDTKTLGEPLRNWFTTSLPDYIRQGITTGGNVVAGLLDTFNMVFGDIWDVVIFPMFQRFTTTILPIMTEFGTEMLGVLDTAFSTVKLLFDTLWSEGVKPGLDQIVQIWDSCWQSIQAFWEEWGRPIFDGIKEAIQNTGDILLSVWESFLKPVWEHFMELVDQVWDEHLKPLLDNFLDFVGELINGALEIYNQCIAPVVQWLVELLGPAFSKVFNGILDTVSTVISNVIDVINGIVTALKGIVQFIVGIFTGDMKKAWEGVKNITKGVWDALVGVVKTPINKIIDLVNGMVGAVVNGVNAIIRGINSISFTVPDWVPGIGGDTFGFQLQELVAPKIPHLAKGGIVDQPTLSLIGEKGKEAVVPLENNTGWMEQLAGRIVQAMLPLLQGNQGSSRQPIVIQFAGQLAPLIRLLKLELDRESQRQGVNLVIGGA